MREAVIDHVVTAPLYPLAPLPWKHEKRVLAANGSFSKAKFEVAPSRTTGVPVISLSIQSKVPVLVSNSPLLTYAATARPRKQKYVKDFLHSPNPDVRMYYYLPLLNVLTHTRMWRFQFLTFVSQKRTMKKGSGLKNINIALNFFPLLAASELLALNVFLLTHSIKKEKKKLYPLLLRINKWRNLLYISFHI